MGVAGKAIQRLIENLSKRGQEIAENALKSVDYTNRTQNLSDSFVWVVYKDGVPVRYGTARQPQAKEPSKKWYGQRYWGSEQALAFVKGFKPPQTKGIALAVVENMPYGEVLERGGGGIKRTYRVIASAQADLKALTGKFKGSTTKIIHHGVAQ